jgi:hypothetical protein
MRTGNHELEKSFWWTGRRLEPYVIYQAAKDSKLDEQIYQSGRSLRLWLELRRTCQTKGRFFKFASARTIAIRRHTPPGAFNPKAFEIAERNEGMVVPATAEAAMPRAVIFLVDMAKGRSRDKKKAQP